MQSRSVLSIAAVCALFALSLAAGGCSQEITGDTIRANMTPELQSLAHTPEQNKNRVAITIDTNMRSIWDDVLSILLLDRPARLNRYPMR